jgi:hypothetical protein
LAIAQPSDPAFNIKATFAHGLSSKKKKKEEEERKLLGVWRNPHSTYHSHFKVDTLNFLSRARAALFADSFY